RVTTGGGSRTARGFRPLVEGLRSSGVGRCVDPGLVVGFDGVLLLRQRCLVLADGSALFPRGESTTHRGQPTREGRAAKSRVSTAACGRRRLPRRGGRGIGRNRTATRDRVGADHMLCRTALH